MVHEEQASCAIFYFACGWQCLMSHGGRKRSCLAQQPLWSKLAVNTKESINPDLLTHPCLAVTLSASWLHSKQNRKGKRYLTSRVAGNPDTVSCKLITFLLWTNREVSMEEGVWDTRLESTQVTVRHWWDFTWNKKIFICPTMQGEINTRHVKRSDGKSELTICFLHSVPDKHYSSLIFSEQEISAFLLQTPHVVWIKGPGKTLEIFINNTMTFHTLIFTMCLSFI